MSRFSSLLAARGTMMRCSHCGVDRETVLDADLIFVSCHWCGKILDQAHHDGRLKKYGKRTSYEEWKLAAGNNKSAITKSHPEGTCQVLKRKSFSSKINYMVLESLKKLDDSFIGAEQDNTKKEPMESGVGDNFELITIEENYNQSESFVEPITDNGGDLCTVESENYGHYYDGYDYYCNNEVYGNGDDDYYIGDEEYGSDECEE